MCLNLNGEGENKCHPIVNIMIHLLSDLTPYSLTLGLLGSQDKKKNPGILVSHEKKEKDNKRRGVLQSTIGAKKSKVSDTMDVMLVSQKLGTHLSLSSGELLKSNLQTNFPLISSGLSSSLSLKTSLLSSPLPSSESKYRGYTLGFLKQSHAISGSLTRSHTTSGIMTRTHTGNVKQDLESSLISRSSVESRLMKKLSGDHTDSGKKKDKVQKTKTKKQKEVKKKPSYKEFEIALPKYTLQHEFSEDKPLEMQPFLSPDKDISVCRHLMTPLHDINGMKVSKPIQCIT